MDNRLRACELRSSPIWARLLRGCQPGSQPASATWYRGRPAISGAPSSWPVSGQLLRSLPACAFSGDAKLAALTGEVAKWAYPCNYTSTDGTSGLVINVLARGAAIGYAATVQASDSVVKGHEITGLGDKAYSNISGLQALFGNVMITVSNLQSDSAAETLIRTLQPKI
jgi:hypothetical protein